MYIGFYFPFELLLLIFKAYYESGLSRNSVFVSGQIYCPLEFKNFTSQVSLYNVGMALCILETVELDSFVS